MKKLTDISDVEIIELYYKYVYTFKWYELLIFTFNIFIFYFLFLKFTTIFFIVVTLYILEIIIYWRYIKSWDIRNRIIEEMKNRKIIK